jgi:RNA recognition motif-containing protein
MNIYIGNLSRQANEEDLSAAFKAFGEVASVSINKDKHTGLSIGVAYVDMPDATEARKAIASLNGKEFKGQNIIVKEARVFEENRSGNIRQGAGAKGGQGFRGGGFNNTAKKQFGGHRKSG